MLIGLIEERGDLRACEPLSFGPWHDIRRGENESSADNLSQEHHGLTVQTELLADGSRDYQPPISGHLKGCGRTHSV